jgi:hypothetical protein
MSRPYRFIVLDHKDDIVCVRLKRPQLDEEEVNELGNELARLIEEDGCLKLLFSLGPEPPQVIYSVFMAKLLMVRRLLLERGGTLKLCDVSLAVRGVFEALRLTEYFHFYPDQGAALLAFCRETGPDKSSS